MHVVCTGDIVDLGAHRGQHGRVGLEGLADAMVLREFLRVSEVARSHTGKVEVYPVLVGQHAVDPRRIAAGKARAADGDLQFSRFHDYS